MALNEITKGMSNAAEQINANFKGLDYKQGTTVNGEYIIFPNGFAICTHKLSETVANTSIGSLYRSQAAQDWEFPIVFKNPPHVTLTIENGSGGSYTGAWAGHGGAISVDKVVGLRLLSPVSGTNSKICPVAFGFFDRLK